MKRNYLKLMALSATMLAAPAMAVDLPYLSAPTDGKTYMLVSRLNPSAYVVPTPWDGAFYLMGYNLDDITKTAVTARANADGSWSFFHQTATTDDEGSETVVTRYMGIPSGTDNLNLKEEETALWYVEQSDVAGFYLLKAGAGHGNDYASGGYLHLNAGGQYLVISEAIYGGGWYPDFYGGVQTDEFEQPVLDDSGFVIPLDPVSRYWAFVELDNVPAYAMKMEIYALIKDIEDNYLADTTYGAGFQGAIDAALPYYNKEELTQEDLDAAKAILNGKLNLYKEILKAVELLNNGEPSAAFSAAINAATTAFNSSNDGSELAAALQALKDAEQQYALGQNDLTVLLQNNSFEDLTSQGGQMTTGVAAPPTGWNVYVKGQQVTTEAEVRAAGITAWHGINDDAEGALDGSYAFGLWTSGVPEYEVSQTLTGLENGSYTIYAAVMVGANGNGSRRTTQRIFGNLNSKYFGSFYEYDESRLDKSEVYDFQGLEEPYTDRLLQEMDVRAYVYDGTLTLGLRTNGDIAAALRDAGNGAGGDGWFKLDNFRLYKEGYIQDDALAIYNHYAMLYDDLSGEKMQNTVEELLASLIDGSIGSGSTQDEINAAIIKLKDMYATVVASVSLYASLQEAIRKGEVAIVDYQWSASADEFGDLLMEAQDMWDEATAGPDEVNAMIAQIEAGIEELKATSITIGDITYVIKNPSFEDLSAQNNSVSDGAQPAPAGWTLKVDGEVAETVSGGWCAINHGDNISVTLDDGTEITHQYTDGEHLWGIWNSNIPEVELSQTFQNMPPGTYTLQADVMVQYNWAGDCTTTQRIFGNNHVQMWGTEGAYSELNLPEDAKNAAGLTYAGWVCAPNQEDIYNSDLLHPMSVTFMVGDNGIATIGFRTNGVNADGLKFADGGLNGQGWFKVDNFRLSYDSTDYDGIEGITTQPADGVAFFSIDGRRLPAAQRGLNIMRTAGKVTKVFVK